VFLEPAYIDSTEVRRHLLWLETRGVGLRTISRRARVARSSLTELRSGTRGRCTRETAERILLVVPVDAADRALISAAPTWKLIDELRAHGHSKASIARELGCGSPALQLGRERLTARNARRVKVLHARLMVSVLSDRRHNAERRRLYRREIAS
jgi:lambda repressor-like predicted transcriptional regulator